MEVKNHIEPHVERRGEIIMVSLDVHGTFDSEWWPEILQGLCEAKCARTRYNLARDNLRERKEIIKINSYKMRNNTTRGYSQES
jgi:hypothetical protein